MTQRESRASSPSSYYQTRTSKVDETMFAGRNGTRSRRGTRNDNTPRLSLCVYLPPDASLLSFKKIQKRKRKKRRTGRQCVNIRPAKRKEKKKRKKILNEKQEIIKQKRKKNCVSKLFFSERDNNAARA